MEKNDRNKSESNESSCQNITTSDITVEVLQNQSYKASRPSQNIPYMQLFHYLKQKFPDVKDCDINESIQRFGLDQDKCEAELQQRCQAHMTGYYGPWGRPAGSSPSNRSSPVVTKSPGGTHSSLSPPFITDKYKKYPTTLQCHQAELSSEQLEYNMCTPIPDAIETQRATALSPTNQNISIPSHTASVQHYIATSQTPIHKLKEQPSDRKHSISSDTMNESDSVNISNASSPAPTLPLTQIENEERLLESPLILHHPVYGHMASSQYNQNPHSLYTSTSKPQHKPDTRSNIPHSEPHSFVNQQIPGNSDRRRLNELNSAKDGTSRRHRRSIPKLPKDHNFSHRRSFTPTRSEHFPDISHAQQHNAQDKSSTLPSISFPAYDPLLDYVVRARVENKEQDNIYEPVKQRPPSRQLSNPIAVSLCGPPQTPLAFGNTDSPVTPIITSSFREGSIPHNSFSRTKDNSSPPVTTKHRASLNFIPSTPHGSQSIISPINKSMKENSDKSYTSVNLRLRQPSTESQPSIDIKTGGNCLTYSTSSLDRRRGSRASLQISIGSSGGSVSAMRTNITSELTNQADDTAFHLQYRSSEEENVDAVTRSLAQNSIGNVAPCGHPTENRGNVHHTGHPTENNIKRQRPQSLFLNQNWQEAGPNYVSYSRRNSLPEHSRFDYQQERGMFVEEQRSQWNVSETHYIQGILVEQKTRKEKLENVLKESYREKEVIQKELSSMHHTLHQTKLKGEQADAANTQRIEDMQQVNSLLQKECDIMEREILHTGEEPEVTDTSGGGGGPSSSSPVSAFAKHNNTFNFTYDRNASSRLLTPARVAPPPPSTRNPQTRHSYAGDESTDYSRLASRWSCSRCTYDNHPDMTTCEICGAIRIPSLPTSLPEPHQSTMLTADHHSSSPSLGQSVQDIFIQVRHQHGYPAPQPLRDLMR